MTACSHFQRPVEDVNLLTKQKPRKNVRTYNSHMDYGRMKNYIGLQSVVAIANKIKY